MRSYFLATMSFALAGLSSWLFPGNVYVAIALGFVAGLLVFYAITRTATIGISTNPNPRIARLCVIIAAALLGAAAIGIFELPSQMPALAVAAWGNGIGVLLAGTVFLLAFARKNFA